MITDYKQQEHLICKKHLPRFNGKWIIKQIGDFTSCTAGGTPSTFIPTYWGGEFRWMNSGELHQKFVNEVEGKITQEGLRNSSTKLIPKKCVLVGLAGQGKTRGTVAINLVELCTNQSIAAIFPSPEHVPEYLYYNLEFRYDELRSFSSGEGGRGGLNLAIIESILVPLPEKPEQRAIAAALSDVDALIAALDRLIAKKRDNKQAAMQELLTGKRRLPGFVCGNRSKQTDVGTIPADWDIITLGDLFTFKNGLNKGKEHFGYGTPIVNYMDVYKRSGIHAADINGRVSLSKQEIKTYEVHKGDVFFTRTSETTDEIGIASVMLDDPKDTVFSGFVLRARPRNDYLDDQFKKYCFSTNEVRRAIVSKSSYTTRALTNGHLLSIVTIPLPSIHEQHAIATVLSDMDAEIAALETRRQKTLALKQGMMQELLTGRIRLVKGAEA